jgi:DNA invertase Pin-like site-specific DNA recombinase
VDELNAFGISFVSLNEGIDFSTPAGKLQFHVLAALSEFERARIVERVRAGMARAKAQGKRFGRPEKRPARRSNLGAERKTLRRTHAPYL